MQTHVYAGRFVLFEKLARSCQALFKRSPRSGVIAGVPPGVSHLLKCEHEIQLAPSDRATLPFDITLFGVSTKRGARRCIRGVGVMAVVLCDKAAPDT